MRRVFRHDARVHSLAAADPRRFRDCFSPARGIQFESENTPKDSGRHPTIDEVKTGFAGQATPAFAFMTTTLVLQCASVGLLIRSVGRVWTVF